MNVVVEELTGAEVKQGRIIADAWNLSERVQEVLTRETATRLAVLAMAIGEALLALCPVLDVSG